ncbi:MAG TPA: hypothetical protein VM553_08475 [Dongiaceae bacterium]|nr:hypothetical protein [Dongiaceae bacterium]
MPEGRWWLFGLALWLALPAWADSAISTSSSNVLTDAGGALPALSYAPEFQSPEWPEVETSVDPEDLPEDDPLESLEPGYMDRSFDYLLKQHKSISTRVEVMARSIDRYLGGDMAMAEENETFMKLQLAERWIEGGKWEPDNDLKFRLDLPATKRRYRLVLTYRPDFDNESLEERTLPSNRVQAVEEDKSLFAGIASTMKNEAENWEGRVQGGIKVHWPLDPFVRFNTKREIELGERWNLNIRSGAAWFAEDGFNANNSFTFDHSLGSNLLFRSTSSVQWREEEDTLEMGQVLDLFHTLDERRLLDYQVGVLGTSFSNPHVNIYYMSLIYRQDLYRHWLYLNVVPQYAFLREEDLGTRNDDNFDEELSLLVGIEVFFNQF